MNKLTGTKPALRTAPTCFHVNCDDKYGVYRLDNYLTEQEAVSRVAELNAFGMDRVFTVSTTPAPFLTDKKIQQIHLAEKQARRRRTE